MALTGSTLPALLAAAQDAGNKVRVCQAALLATNVAIRSLADKAEEARKALKFRR